ncbi:MAG: ROK family protein, partial [Actinobacteria bacterium]|nr:ROK family protein [Actinomycetota bacterium]
MSTAKTAADGAVGAQSLAIGIDVGGTKISAGVVSSTGRILEQLCIPTADSGQELAQVLAGIVDQLRAAYSGVLAVGVGAAGLVEWPAGYIRWAPNNSYRHLPLQAQLADATGLPTIVDNDANAAAWAEAHVRSEGGFSDLVYVT